ncbi:uncharacterized protein LOC117150886 [Drosophila mauritiana]|uniref:Uncharacterized protein LOC117150886 n=1 Tax=Drosophila mauritiana TaxID=7226 RepID=A0A6P8KU29_DROMA|nr:uncharacterized protein LOC117150886 [Drosophila mauritiana]
MHFYNLIVLCLIHFLDLTARGKENDGFIFCIHNYRGWCWNNNASVWSYGR